MGGVFINYQRGDHGWLITELHTRLTDFLGQGQVFLDRAAIDVGKDYRAELRARVTDCEVVLAVIDGEWLARRTARVDDPTDWVRVELELALELGRTIIPILVDDTVMPKARELPSSIHEVAYQQAHRVRRDDQDTDVSELVEKLELELASPWRPLDTDWPRDRPAWPWLRFLTAAATVAALVVPAVVALDHAPASDDASAPALEYLVLLVVLIYLPLPVLLLRTVFRKPSYDVDASLHEMTQTRYHRLVALPLVGLGTAFLLAVNFGLDRTQQNLPFVIVVMTGVFGFVVWKMHDEERREQARNDGWPQELSRPVLMAPVRRELARLERRLRDWPRFRLSWEMRQKSIHVLGEMNEAVTALAKESRRGRHRWVTTEHPWLLSLYLVWVAGAIGTAAALVVPDLEDRSLARLVLPPVLIGAICAVAALATAELAYRYQLDQRKRFLKDVRGRVARIQGLLDELLDRRA